MSIFPSLTSRLRLPKLLIFVVSIVLVLALSSLSTPSQTPKRDKFLWPFASTSIWNMPIGSKARYVPANIAKAKLAEADQEYFYKLKQGDPERPVIAPGAWGEGRCTGTQPMGISLPVPDNLIVPDATKVPFSTPNNASAFLLPDGKNLVQLSPLARCQPGGGIYGFRYSSPAEPDGFIDIYGPGIGGAHFGSRLSSIGGSIRKGELIGKQPIRHALKVVLWGEKYLYYSKSLPGFRWPATGADNNAANQYHGKNRALVQGSLLAIPPKITERSLKLQTPAGKKLFFALQNYGAYVVDDAGWDAHYFGVEKGVLEEFRAKYGYNFQSVSSGPFYEDFMKLFQALYVVDNNGPNSIGGGGKPRQPLAPPIGN
ncbi:hypothetical protein [Iningainema tapete]|uniref:Uncharacterized protein n=1 Tax=Iningainema tapete BLCC-T55 TaxID=2748662 RepID=A0A8J6XRW0_9CYAN|nr:hypothetical protein [Iningainema tapete]MBD2778467.1 hypothetical protein [Iningainema tapete BLCC-T55]